MADKILIQKIKFARELLIVFKLAAVACAVLAVVGPSWALSCGKPRAAAMGFLASAAGTALWVHMHRHIKHWLMENEAPEKDRSIVTNSTR